MVRGVTRYDLISADAHVLEPPDIWENHLPEKYQDEAPKLVKDRDGGDAWKLPDSDTSDPIGLTATPGMPWDQFRWMGVTYDEARPGCYNGGERLKDMDLDGVDAEVIFPPQRTIGHWLGHEDPDVSLAGIEAYNNFLWDEFCAPDPSRLIGMAQIPSLGIDSAVDTLRKAKARGFKGVVISNWPSGGEMISEDDDPFWAAAVDEGMPVTIHINLVSREQRIQARKAAANASIYGEGEKKELAGARAAAGLSSVFGMVPNVVGQLVFTGTFQKFPDLHVSMIEVSTGWIPHFLEQMDDRYWRNRSWTNVPITEPPSHYWYRNMSATFVWDPAGIRQRHQVGVDNMMWSTDYPHHGNDWPYSRKVINETMAECTPEEQRKILAENAIRIWNLED